MTTDIDLHQLSNKPSGSTTNRLRHQRPFVSRYIVPGVVVLGFVAMLCWAARDRFLSSTPVTVVPVVVTRAEVQHSGSTLFQAAGWIEPRPTAVLVPSLTEGIVAELLVVEGQDIRANQPVARLIDADAKLGLEQAEADLDLQISAHESAKSDLESAHLRLKHPLHLKAALSEAQSVLAKAEGELARIPFQIQAARSRHEFTERDLAGKQEAGSSIAVRALRQAQSDHDSALAELNDLTERPARLQREVQGLRGKQEALSSQMDLLIDEKRQLAVAEGVARTAKNRVRQAELAVQAAQLRLARTTIVSPVSGRVLALVSRPGARVMGLDPSGEQRANTIVTLYDPQCLQVRADVRLEDVPLIEVGQPVKIETASAKGPIHGKVLRATSQANVQKNTLDVKVAITDPPASICPEMLVTVTFLAPERSVTMPTSEQQERLLVPRQLIDTEGESKFIWIADANGTARRKQLRVGKGGTRDLVEVLEGLSPTDRLISGNREAMAEGTRITISGEDASLGMSDAESSR